MLHFIIIEDEDHGANVLLQIMSQHFPELIFDGRAATVRDAVAAH